MSGCYSGAVPLAARPDQLRRDARDNRAAILDAARELFADSADVAMSQIARRAGVGQGTLYRHFPNRGTLAGEILDEYIVRFEALATAEADDPDAFFVLHRRPSAGVGALFRLWAPARHEAEADTHLQRNRQRIAELLEVPMRDAKRAGTLRPDLSVADVFLIFAMARGAMEGLPDRAARAAVAQRVLALLLAGVEP